MQSGTLIKFRFAFLSLAKFLLMPAKSSSFYNYTIIGAGASGLWLAYSLFKHGLLKDNTLVIVEQDTQKNNDRTWCYWAKEELEPKDFSSKSWSYSENYHNYSNTRSIFPYTYYHIRSQDFYQKIKAILSICKNITWLYTSFQGYQLHDLVTVKTDEALWQTNKLFLSGLNINENVFSSGHLKTYLNNNSNHHILLWQSFAGWRIKTEKPVFDKARMTIMDFNIPQNQHTQFMYVLPFTENEALVELTRFGETKLCLDDAKIILENYVAAKNTSYTIEETEIGNIPMTTHFDIKRKKLEKNESIIYLGTVAGAIKPTSGYGFKRMAKYADDLAIALALNLALPTQYRSWRFRVYDILLLQILEQHSNKGKQIFDALFKSQPVPKILKFLDEETTIWEEISIFSKLPILLFLKSVVKLIFK